MERRASQRFWTHADHDRARPGLSGVQMNGDLRSVAFGRQTTAAPRPLHEVMSLVRDHIVRELDRDGVHPLSDLPFTSLVNRYVTWRYRFIRPLPRTVRLSAEHQASDFGGLHPQVAAVLSEIESGIDLTARLSKQVAMPLFPPTVEVRPSEPWQDGLLFDWGIHHLHLGLRNDANGGWAERTNDLLFVMFTAESAFVLGVFPHQDSFDAKAVFDVMARNWPDEIPLLALLEGFSASSESPDDLRRKSRVAGIISGLQVDGKLFMPMGQTTAGTPLVAAYHTRCVAREIKRLVSAPEAASEEADRLLPRPRTSPWAATIIDDRICLLADGEVIGLIDLCAQWHDRG